MKSLFDDVSIQCSKAITNHYSTSFSIGIKLLSPEIRPAIYSIYGFVRLADEIVDSFYDYDSKELLEELRASTQQALDKRISTNPVLHAFQETVHKYHISREHINTFLDSMEMDLHKQTYNKAGYEQYIVGSAEVVGLMCLKVFCLGDQKLNDELKEYAMRLGAAFQKINFLRDMKADYEVLGRLYFPGINIAEFDETVKVQIEADILLDFQQGLIGIKKLPQRARFGVYVAYYYYRSLFNKIKGVKAKSIMHERIRISNPEKVGLLCYSYMRYQMNAL
ncbi:MAG: phytoene/squalene synthase family protein [Cytophagales bacterium]|nr:phytoene/squalene synthase family protein [Cytophaga sp.]